MCIPVEGKQHIENIARFQNVVQTVNKVSDASRSRLVIEIVKVLRDMVAILMSCWRWSGHVTGQEASITDTDLRKAKQGHPTHVVANRGEENETHGKTQVAAFDNNNLVG